MAEFIIQGKAQPASGNSGKGEPKGLESANVTSRGETTRSAVNKLGERLDRRFGQLERQLGGSVKVVDRPAPPPFASNSVVPIQRAVMSFPTSTKMPAAAVASPVVSGGLKPAVTSSTVAPAARPTAMAFPTPRALDSATSNRNRTGAAVAFSGAPAVATAPIAAPGAVQAGHASGSAPAAFAGQPKPEAMPRSIETSSRSAFVSPAAAGSTRAPVSSLPAAPGTVSAQPASSPVSSFVTRSSPAFPSTQSPSVRDLASGPNIGFRTASARASFSVNPAVAAPASAALPGAPASQRADVRELHGAVAGGQVGPRKLAAKPQGRSDGPRGFADATAFSRYEGMRPASSAQPAGSKGPGGMASIPDQKVSPVEFSKDGVPQGSAAAAPAPGQMSSITARGADPTKPQAFASHPNLPGARMEQKAKADEMAKSDIKKAPWGDNKTQNEMLDVLKDIQKTLKEQG